MKKVAGKKQRDTAAADAEMKAKRLAAEGKDNQENVDPGKEGPTDILSTGDDEDVIF